jgi:ubiquitin carboxyl-terminal hydrolase 7
MNNFGGNSSDDITFRHSSNAYMLVYIRDSCKEDILQVVSKNDIPANLHDRLTEERRLELIKKKERSEAPNFMQLNILLEEEFIKHSGAELYDVYKTEATK